MLNRKQKPSCLQLHAFEFEVYNKKKKKIKRKTLPRLINREMARDIRPPFSSGILENRRAAGETSQMLATSTNARVRFSGN